MSCRFQADPYTRRILQRVVDLERDVNRLKQYMEEDESMMLTATSPHPEAEAWMGDDPPTYVPVVYQHQFTIAEPRYRFVSEMLKKMSEFADRRHRHLVPTPEPIAAIPEHWQARTPQVPQAALLLAEVKDDGSLGESRWSMAVPHYRHDQGFQPNLQFQKGNFQGKLFLKDNSQLLVYAHSMNEAERIIAEIKSWINPEQVGEEPQEVYGKRKGQQLSDKTVKLIRIAFYSEGQRNQKPDWIVNVNETA